MHYKCIYQIELKTLSLTYSHELTLPCSVGYAVKRTRRYIGSFTAWDDKLDFDFTTEILFYRL